MQKPLCRCGCGQPAPICTHTNLKEGIRKGEPRRFIAGHQFNVPGNRKRVRTLEELFWPRVKKSPGCWEWTGGKDKQGYGKFYRQRGEARAHRFSYRLAFGPIPDGKNVLHRCDNPSCVRPDHLFVGTAKDNTQDAISKDRLSRIPRGPSARNKSKTHCIHGHPLSGTNLRILRSTGERVCRICAHEREKRHAQKKVLSGTSPQ